MSDINIDNLRQFVGALREVVDTEPSAAVVDMKSECKPACGTPGCHAGLAMLALDRLGFPDLSDDRGYQFMNQAIRLSELDHCNHLHLH